jgi:sensor histidine kinase YesM
VLRRAIARPLAVKRKCSMPAAPLPAIGSCAIPPRRAFARVFNLRTVGLVFFFCLLLVISRTLPALHYEPLDEWAVTLLRAMRQNMISGLLLLLTIALADAAVVRWQLGRRAALALGLTAVLAVSAVAMVLRGMVYGTPFTEIPLTYFITITSLWAAFGAVAYTIFFLLREDEQQRELLCEADLRSQSLNAQMLQARLSALQAQIEPHFLFNTLANVKRLYETTPTRGRAMLASLIDYLRAVLPSMRENGSTLGRELELARSFLTILQMRMGERLSFSIDAPAALLATPMPPMILATLLENSIKHGLAPLPEGGRIDISAQRSGDHLVLVVRDNGAGIKAVGGSGVGLANTRSRLTALYGADATLDLAASAPRGFVATVRIPAFATDVMPAPLEAYA